MSSSSEQSPSEQPKKIIIDEDWKSQVQAEKAAAQSTPEPADDESNSSAEQRGELPPASLSFLLTTLATQAMVAMGDIPNPITGKADVHMAGAKHFIDMLAVLEEKTAGNRTADESSLLASMLYQLRIGYVEMQKQQPGKLKT